MMSRFIHFFGAASLALCLLSCAEERALAWLARREHLRVRKRVGGGLGRRWSELMRLMRTREARAAALAEREFFPQIQRAWLARVRSAPTTTVTDSSRIHLNAPQPTVPHSTTDNGSESYSSSTNASPSAQLLHPPDLIPFSCSSS